MPVVPAEWAAGAPIEDGSAYRIYAHMGACPPVRVDVADGPDAVTITLYERWPDGVEAIPAIGISMAVDVPLPTPLRGRPVLDGASGRRREPLRDLDGTAPRVPVGREFTWQELTGRPWFGGR